MKHVFLRQTLHVDAVVVFELTVMSYKHELVQIFILPECLIKRDFFENKCITLEFKVCFWPPKGTPQDIFIYMHMHQMQKLCIQNFWCQIYLWNPMSLLVAYMHYHWETFQTSMVRVRDQQLSHGYHYLRCSYLRTCSLTFCSQFHLNVI